MTKDFNIQVKVRNARLLNAIRKKFGTPAAMARAANINPTNISDLLNFKILPFKKNGDEGLTVAAQKISKALNMSAVQLWPNQIAQLKTQKSTAELELDTRQAMGLAYDGPEQQAIYKQMVTRWTDGLTPREKTVLTLRSCGYTLEDIRVRIGNVGRERVRGIEQNALEKMKFRAKRDGVKSFTDIVE
jgi:DNA-binding NarL/FixJ family response regulator